MEQREIRYSFLVIEDSRGDFALAEEYLHDQFTAPSITRAATFKEVKSVFDDMHGKLFDCIILDLSLPDKSGEELIEEVVRMANDIPVVILTGYSDISFSVKSLEKGVSDYLLKDELNSAFLFKSIIYSIKRNQFSQKIKASEKKYRDLFDLSPKPMWVIDNLTKQFLDVNKAAVEHYGYSKEEFLSSSSEKIRSKKVAPALEEMGHGAVNTGNNGQIQHQEHIKKDGEVIKVEIESNRITYQNKDATLVLSTDVTEKLRAEERQMLFESVITHTTESVIILDSLNRSHESNVIYVNDGFYELTGYNFEEVNGRAIDFLFGEKTDSDDVQKVRNAIFNRETCEVELICNKKDGSTFWLQNLIVPVSDNSGRNNRMVLIGRDVTERKKKDETLQNSLHEKEILLAEIHHRIKNNLALVSGMLQMQVFDEENEEVVNKLNNSMLRVETMASIHQLLYESSSFSTLEFSKIVNKLIKATHNSFRSNKEIEIEIDTEPFELNINQAVPSSLIINEVITNVYKHAFKERVNGWIKAQLRRDGDEVIFSIEDNGVGLPDGFDMSQLSSLGTKIITALVKQLNGTFELARREEGGTMFQLVFSVKDERAVEVI